MNSKKQTKMDTNNLFFSLSKTILDNGKFVEMVIAENITVNDFYKMFSDKGYIKVNDSSLVGFHFVKENGDSLQLIPSYHKKGEIIRYAKGGGVGDWIGSYKKPIKISDVSEFLNSTKNDGHEYSLWNKGVGITYAYNGRLYANNGQRRPNGTVIDLDKRINFWKSNNTDTLMVEDEGLVILPEKQDKYNCYTTGYDGLKNKYGNEDNLTLKEAVEFCWYYDDVRKKYATKEDLEKEINSTPYGKENVIASTGNISGVVVYKVSTQQYAKGGGVGKHDSWEMIVISKELNKDGGKFHKNRFLVSATSIDEAKKITEELWNENFSDSDLSIVSIMSESIYRLRYMDKYAKGGVVGDTFSNVLLSYDFEPRKSFAGINFFVNKKHKVNGKIIYATVDLKNRHLILEDEDLYEHFNDFSIQKLIDKLNELGFISKMANGGGVGNGIGDYVNQYFGKGYENDAIIELRKALPNHTFEKGKNSIIVDGGRFVIHTDFGKYGFIRAYSNEGSEGGLSVQKLDEAISFISDNSKYAKGGGVGEFVVKIYSTNYENTLISEKNFKTEKAAIRYAYSVDDLNDDGFYFNIYGLDKNGKTLIRAFGLEEADEDLIKQNPKYKNCVSWKLDMRVASYPNNKTIFSKTFSSLDKALELGISLENESLSATINNRHYTTFVYANDYAKGGGVGNVWIALSKTKNGLLLSESFQREMTNKQLFDYYKKKGYIIIDSNIFKVTNKNVLEAFKDAVSKYIQEKYNESVDWQNTLLSYEIVGDKVIAQSCWVQTKNGNEYEVTPNDLVNKHYAIGGGISEFPQKGELTNKDNFLLKYEKNGDMYEFYIYKPETKKVSGYNQKKHICINSECPYKMSYQQFIDYLYASLYLDDRKYAKGGEVENEMFDEEFYIEFLNKKKGFKKDKIYFRSYEEATDWGRKNLESFSPDMIKIKMFEKSEGGKIQQVEMEIDLVYSRSGFLNENGSWKEKLIELLQDASFEAYMIYKKLNPIQKQEVIEELYEMDNDMGSYGDGDIETTKENLSIMLMDAQNGKVYGRGGAVKYLKNISRKIQKGSFKSAKKGVSTAIKKGKQAVDTTKSVVKEKIKKEKKGIALNVISETIKTKAKGREETSTLQNASSIIKKRYKNGGRLKTYMSISNYRKMLEKLSDEKLLSFYVDEYGFDINEPDHMLRIENERDSVIDDLVYEYSRMMKSSGRL